MIGMCFYAHKVLQQKVFTIVISLLIMLAALLFSPDRHLYFISSISLLLSVELVVRLYKNNVEARILSLQTERLRGDLLKKNLRPHFLMNSLTALMEWVETNPEKAVDFIETR